jgi:hypothetical protein
LSGEKAEEEVHEEEKPQEKMDLKRLLAVIPPPSEVLSRKRQGIKEKRIRLLYDSNISEEEARISPFLARELGAKEYVEVSVAGKKRFRLKVNIDENISPDYVYVNSELMKKNGVANNSICTIRAV